MSEFIPGLIHHEVATTIPSLAAAKSMWLAVSKAGPPLIWFIRQQVGLHQIPVTGQSADFSLNGGLKKSSKPFRPGQETGDRDLRPSCPLPRFHFSMDMFGSFAAVFAIQLHNSSGMSY